MNLKLVAFVLAVILCLTKYVVPDELESIMVTPPPAGVVVEVMSGDEVKLDDGTIVELMGVEGPDTERAREWLKVYVLDRRVTLRNCLRVGYGRVRAVPVLWEKTDVCGLMLMNGHVSLRLAGTEPPVMVKRWRGYEEKARLRRLGIWTSNVIHAALPPYRPAGVIVTSPGW